MDKENNVTVSPNDEVYKKAFANSPVVNSSVISHYENVNHPSHYNNYSKEVIDMMENIWGIENLITFCEMNAFKYRMRMGTKPDNSIEQDLKKEKWYLNKAKELKQKLQKTYTAPDDDEINNKVDPNLLWR